jgi:hypothetical protein
MRGAGLPMPTRRRAQLPLDNLIATSASPLWPPLPPSWRSRMWPTGRARSWARGAPAPNPWDQRLRLRFNAFFPDRD